METSYKEKYEQALEVAKETYNKQPMYKDWLEKMFPELSVSEDEKVRKGLIEILSKYKYYYSKEIAWLKKQGKPTDEEMKTLLRTEYEKGRADAIAEKEWSEEDELQMQAIIDLLPGLTIRHNWLKSLKGRVQPKQEWSEEDKDFMYDTLSNLTELKDRYGEGYGNVGRCIDWLKSLRPQDRWKPSDEQMELLSEVQSALLGKDCHNRFTDFMWELKKLKEG